MRRFIERFIQCSGLVLLILISPNVSNSSPYVDWHINPQWSCPILAGGETSDGYQVFDVTVYWCLNFPESGDPLYMFDYGYGECGGSVACNGYDLATGCAPDFQYCAWCTSETSGRVTLHITDFEVECTTYSCPPGSPAQVGYECTCEQSAYHEDEGYMEDYDCC